MSKIVGLGAAVERLKDAIAERAAAKANSRRQLFLPLVNQDYE